MTFQLLNQLTASIKHNRDHAESTIDSLRAALVNLEPPSDSESLRTHIERKNLLEGLARTQAWKEQMDAALARIDSGVYGICVDCGDQIRERRLMAQPWSARCTFCEERHELALLKSENGANVSEAQPGRHA
jgi:RNA polymerase-binding transcription factor DksA